MAITLQSEHEESKCVGSYTAQDDGFVLEFKLGEGNYKVVKSRDGIKLSVDGVLSYAIDFDNGGEVELSTPFGNMVYRVEPRRAEIKECADGLTAELCYALKSGAEIIDRAVTVTASRLR